MRRKAKRLLFVLGSIIGILIFIGMIIWFAWPTIRGVYWNTKNKAYIEENKTAEMNQIVFLGDSLTDGFDLNAYFSSDLVIYNRGIGGDKTDGVFARLESNVLAIEPSIIVLLIGINDIHGGRSLEAIEKNYRKILDKIQEELPECDVYIESLYPTNTMIYSHFTDYWDDILLFNTTLQTLALEYNYVYMDVYTELLDGEELNRSFTFDGLHLNSDGYHIVSDVIVTYVNQLNLSNEEDGS
ncbi:MAG: hypothetical protein CVV56_03500 [Tenericutes bacterium HGW-Tenericutes-1]|nr:MAG: hypothetical protein CVV56_03500 [Tenericutes bacterium HGW-Tenericutes-1]